MSISNPSHNGQCIELLGKYQPWQLGPIVKWCQPDNDGEGIYLWILQNLTGQIILVNIGDDQVVAISSGWNIMTFHTKDYIQIPHENRLRIWFEQFRVQMNKRGRSL